jgi:hypothetical protein
MRLLLQAGRVQYRCGNETVVQEFVGANSDASYDTEVQGYARGWTGSGGRLQAASAMPILTRVTYRDLYPGVSFHVIATAQGLKTEFELAPGSDLSGIRFRYEGGGRPTISVDGELVVHCAGGSISERGLFAYQSSSEGKQEQVAVAYSLSPDGSVGFSVGKFDPAHTLTIDPYVVLQQATFGSPAADVVTASASDPAGNIYLAGYSEAPLPALAGVSTFHGGVEAFVMKLQAGTRRILFISYLGGSGDDRSTAVALNTFGDVFVGGYTNSSDFFLAPGKLRGSRDGFVARINAASGEAISGDLIGGSGSDEITSIGCTAGGDLWFAGTGDSPDLQLRLAQQPSRGGRKDGFLGRLTSTGTLQSLTYFGGSGDDEIKALTVGPAGEIYIVGSTTSTDLPVRAAFQPMNAGGARCVYCSLFPNCS